MAFIAFEGLDGSGKSTLIKNLQSFLDSQGLSYVSTREPGGTPLGETLREIILKDQVPSPSPRTELLLYEAVRAQHMAEKIRPHIERGDWVITDRFTASTVAFQAGGREISTDQVAWLNDFATGGLQPDLIILLDISYEDSQKRMAGRSGESKDRIEKESKAFHQRVRQSYLDQSEQDKGRWLVLDAQLSPERLVQDLLSHLRQKDFFK